jgi:hypothetical protein
VGRREPGEVHPGQPGRGCQGEPDHLRHDYRATNHGDLAFLNDPAAALPWSTQEVVNHIVTFLDGHLRRQ